jgi:hypothetical protein
MSFKALSALLGTLGFLGFFFVSVRRVFFDK